MSVLNYFCQARYGSCSSFTWYLCSVSEWAMYGWGLFGSISLLALPTSCTSRVMLEEFGNLCFNLSASRHLSSRFGVCTEASLFLSSIFHQYNIIVYWVKRGTAASLSVKLINYCAVTFNLCKIDVLFCRECWKAFVELFSNFIESPYLKIAAVYMTNIDHLSWVHPEDWKWQAMPLCMSP